MQVARLSVLVLIPMLVLAGCDGDTAAPENPMVSVSFTNLEVLDAATEGSYEGWVIDAGGVAHSTGKFVLNGASQHNFASPLPDPTMFVLTVEPPGDNDDVPSDQKLLGGALVGGAGTLTALGFVSASAAADFTANPGTHVLLTPTDGPANEDAGLWLLNPPAPGGAPTAAVQLPPLASGWVYEGWVVFMPGTAQQVAISYGKYSPQADGTLSGRDSDAGGPLSGAPGDPDGGPPFPGSDFVLANGNTVPGGLQIPFDFNGDDVTVGDSDWMHVISIEPSFDQGEATLDAVPFQLKPFGNQFGDGGPTDARTIETLAPLPGGSVTVAS